MSYLHAIIPIFKRAIVCFFIVISHTVLQSQTINFGSTGLVGTNVDSPTSLDFGPNNRLYVAQQDGIIWEYQVGRDGATAGNGTYTILNSSQILLIKNNIPNHNDDGTFNSTQARQITGLLATGSASNPILYVTSSDSRIGGGGGAGNDVNLDTNSGVLSRLRWNGSAWEKVDLVRGLPRCEENHSTNGMDLFTSGGNTYLLIQQGGNTNQGAPSNNFAGSSEYYLSGALLIVNITQLEQMEASNGGPYLDPRTNNSPYIYDLPSINDPERPDIDNTDPSFPYGPAHPLYNAIIDIGDPFGGNNGLNQTFPESGGPVQIFSPGYRNAFDVVITESGGIFTSDNGSNGGWGGAPLIYDDNDLLKGTHHSTTYNPLAGDYVTNEFNIENGTSLGDSFHYVGSVSDPNNTYYAGHPNPIRAFPDKAGVFKFEYDGSDWVESGAYSWSTLINGVQGYFNPAGFTMADFPEDTRQGDYLTGDILNTEVNILDVVPSSTNGICEYTATNFEGAMQGDILTASFNGNINRYSLNPDGTTLSSKDNGFFNGFGSIPLDLIAQGDTNIFPGTIWVVTYGANDITIFEPGDFGDCFIPGDPEYDETADYDGDGFTNFDEINNGTNHCSAGSSPNDNDNDFISDLADPDDDNDGILDNQDVFAIDPQNGLTTNLPISYPFWNNDPGTGFFGLGFTGLQLDPSGGTDYLTQFDTDNLSFGGAGGKATVDEVSSGDALNALNSQENAFQFGINVDSNSNPFTIYGKIETPFNGSAPLATQSYGVYIGNGDQDNYLKVALMDGTTSGDSVYGFEVVLENNGISTIATFDAPGLLQAPSVDLYISVNPSSNTAQVFYSLDGGLNINALGNSYVLPNNLLDANDNKGLAVGLIGTSGSSGATYIATWDFIIITEDQTSSLEPTLSILDFGQSSIDSSPNELNLEVKNIGNPMGGSIEITQISITGPHANLFSSDLALPISLGPQADVLIPVTFNPNAITGVKLASLEIVHDGVNSPLIVPLTAELIDSVPVVRISAGSATTITSTDIGPDWELNPTSGSYSGVSYSVNTGNIFGSTFLYSNRHSSIPDYIDENTFNGLFNDERWDDGSAPEMEFLIPIPNGNYTINLFLGNSYEGTDQIGDRVFDILIEGAVVQDDLDLISTFGHQVAGMLSYPVIVNDGVLNISFEHVTENPLINAIEVIQESLIINQPPIAVASADPLVGEAPLNVTFTGVGSTDDNNNIVSYDWDFGNGDTSSEINPNYIFTNPGNYTVTLTVTDGDRATDTDTITINAIATIPCEWNDLADSSLEKIEAQSAKVGDKLYVFAGFLANLQITGATEIYDTTNDTWTTGAPMPTPVTHMGAVVVGTDIWIIAGFTGNHPGVATNEVQIYNTVTDSWSNGPALPDNRASGAAVLNDGKIHHFGGLLPDRQTDVGEHYVYDPNNPGLGWVSAADLPDPRNHLSGASVNGLVYAIGGQYGHDVSVADQKFLDVYDPNTDAWTRLADLPSERSHFEPGTIVHDDKIIIVGGRQGETFFYDDVTEYDPATDQWSERCELPDNLLAPAAKVFGNRLIVANGGIEGIDEPISSTRWISLDAGTGFPPLVLDPIADQSNNVGESSTLTLFASGGDPNENVTYAISGQPAGLGVEPTNGQIIGSIDTLALIGGPNNDGIHAVTVTASKLGSIDATLQFTWTITSDSGNFWFDKDEDENYTARHECSFVQAGDKFYLFGGRENAQTLDIYDYTTDSWNSLVDSAPMEFNHFQAVEYQGLIWVIGAFRTNNFPSEVPADYIWAFNPATQEWIQGPEIPVSRKRGSTGLVIYNDKFYILAGNTDGHDGGYVNWFDEYDPATGIWTELSDAPRARDHFHAAVIDGKLYAASGRLSGGTGGVFAPVISEVDVYDFATQSWSTLPSAQNLPTPRAAAIVANFENKLIVAGGETETNPNAFDITEVFDPISQTWSVGNPLNHPRHGTQGIVSGNGIHVTGGSPLRGGDNQKNMEFYGQDNPVGTVSLASTLSADTNVSFAIGETKTILLTNSGGNIGTLLKNMTLTGPDASEFTIDSGDVPFKLIPANSNHAIVVSYNGTTYDKNAILTININNSGSIIINLSVPTGDLIYDGTSWTPHAPDETTASDNAVIMSGSFSITSDIEINNLSIEPDASLIVEAENSITANGDINIGANGVMELQSTSTSYSSLIANGSVNGNIEYRRHVNTTAAAGQSGSNDLIAPPLSGQAFNDFKDNNTNIVSNGDDTLYLFGPFNKTTGAYDIYADTEIATLDAGVGYRAASTDNSTFTFTGLVNTGQVQIPISNSGPAFQIWNLIGNPYPSYIHLGDFLNLNNSEFSSTSAGIYGYDGDASDGWVVWNLVYSELHPDALIAPGQGFFVASDAVLGTVTFEPSMRVKGQSDDFIENRSNASPTSYLKLGLNQNDKTYYTDFYFSPNASRGLDKGYDAQIWGGNTSNFSLYSYLVEENTGIPMTIQSLGETDYSDVRIPLGVNANIQEQLSISIFENTLPSNVEVYLEDLHTQNFVLLNNSDYTLTLSNVLNADDRFFLRFTENALSAGTSILNRLNIFNDTHSKSIVISGLIYEPTAVKLYDIQGRIVVSDALKLNTITQQLDTRILEKGVYVISLESNTEKMTKKLIIR